MAVFEAFSGFLYKHLNKKYKFFKERVFVGVGF